MRDEVAHRDGMEAAEELHEREAPGEGAACHFGAERKAEVGRLRHPLRVRARADARVDILRREARGTRQHDTLVGWLANRDLLRVAPHVQHVAAVRWVIEAAARVVGQLRTRDELLQKQDAAAAIRDTQGHSGAIGKNQCKAIRSRKKP